MSLRRVLVTAAVAVALAASLAIARTGGGTPQAPASLRVTIHGAGLVDDVATAIPVARERVVTVAHALVPTPRRVEVAGRPARVVRLDGRADVAVLAVPGLDATPATFARVGARAASAVVLRRGGRRAVPADPLREVMARVRPVGGGPPQRRPALELAAAIVPGDSGAPVVDAGGRVVGMVFARSTRRDGVAWAVAAPAVRRAAGR